MPEERKLVSVLFADTVGSTALGAEHDPELVRSTMARYFERMRAIAERHGGTVEKYIGDAVMVVFRVRRVHDDDAERAVRTGLAMRDELAELNRELAPPPPWNYRATRRRALAAAVAGQATRATRSP